jgi:hypothetical protein
MIFSTGKDTDFANTFAAKNLAGSVFCVNTHTHTHTPAQPLVV